MEADLELLMYITLSLLAGFLFLYSVVSGGLERTPVSGALVFTTFGFLFGPLGLGYLEIDIDARGLRTLAELTLALVLFLDAANVNLGELKKSFHIPQRMVLIGLPLSIVLGTVAGVLLFDDLVLLEIAVLATMLAATDAALGKAVIMNKAVPARIREGLNFESGLNDGVCVPILFLFLALATAKSMESTTTLLALKLLAAEIGIGAAVGIGLTLISVRLIKLGIDRGWITEVWMQLLVPALAVCCFTAAQALHGSGFIAAFVGGLLFGANTTGKEKQHFLHAAEGTGETLALVTWVIFGAAVVGQALPHFSWHVVAYSVLSLTVIRMLPIYLSLIGTGLRADERLFMGWFGPRGLATIVFAVIVLGSNLPHGGTIVTTAVCTIILSIILHGLSANLLIEALAARMKHTGSQSTEPNNPAA
jgi:NhaP-type Na+/H+ or K+/H+ antiporter